MHINSSCLIISFFPFLSVFHHYHVADENLSWYCLFSTFSLQIIQMVSLAYNIIVMNMNNTNLYSSLLLPYIRLLGYYWIGVPLVYRSCWRLHVPKPLSVHSLQAPSNVEGNRNKKNTHNMPTSVLRKFFIPKLNLYPVEWWKMRWYHYGFICSLFHWLFDFHIFIFIFFKHGKNFVVLALTSRRFVHQYPASSSSHGLGRFPPPKPLWQSP